MTTNRRIQVSAILIVALALWVIIASSLIGGCKLLMAAPLVVEVAAAGPLEPSGVYGDRAVLTRTERVRFVPIMPRSTPENPAGGFVPVYSVPVMASGQDSILIMGQFEVTNNMGFTTPCGWGLFRSSSADVIGSCINPAVMENVLPEQHHMPRTVVWVDDQAPTGLCWYHLVLWAKHDRYTGQLEVEPGYGFLRAEIRP